MIKVDIETYNGTYDGTYDCIDWMKSIKYNLENVYNEEELAIYKKLLGHTNQDIDKL